MIMMLKTVWQEETKMRLGKQLNVYDDHYNRPHQVYQIPTMD